MFKNKTIYFLYLALALILINPQISAQGAANGLILWLNTIIPTLFPFMIIANMLVKVYGNSFKRPIVFSGFLGLLCGFPVCAMITNQLCDTNTIDKKTAQFLVNCTNISSPMFILAYMINHGLNTNKSLIPLLIIYIPTFLLITYYFTIYNPVSINKSVSERHISRRELIIMLDDSIYASSQNMLKIGGYIIIFSMIAYTINMLPINNHILKAFIIGIFEITNGINYISQAQISFEHKLILITMITNFGGLCTFAQTNCVLTPGNISLKKYLKAKLLLMSLTFLVGVIFITLN